MFIISRYSNAYWRLNCKSFLNCYFEPLIPTFYLVIFDGFSETPPNCMFITVFEKFHPTWLLGPTRLLNIKPLYIQHAYLDYTFIRNTRVHTWFKQFVERFWSFFVRFQSLWINWFQVGFWTTESRIMPTESARSSILKRKLMLPEMFYRISGDYLL